MVEGPTPAMAGLNPPFGLTPFPLKVPPGLAVTILKIGSFKQKVVGGVEIVASGMASTVIVMVSAETQKVIGSVAVKII
jgi:hypothetical protein